MISHIDSHYFRKGLSYHRAIVKIGVINRGSSAGSFRPEEHAFNAMTGKFFFGSDACLHRFCFPNGVRIDGAIKCRFCDDFTVEFHDCFSKQMQVKRVNAFNLHEFQCQI